MHLLTVVASVVIVLTVLMLSLAQPTTRRKIGR